MKIENGRPSDFDQRQPREQRVYDWLDSLGITYQRADHDAADNMELCIDIEKELGAPICKNLFLCNRQKTRYFLLMMPGDKKFLTKNLSAQIQGPRLSFAGPDDMLSMLDVLPGSVSVLGLMNDKERRIQLLIDSDLLKLDHVGCHPCANTSSLKIAIKDLTEKILPALQHEPLTVYL